jgi:hypothetical protein
MERNLAMPTGATIGNPMRTLYKVLAVSCLLSFSSAPAAAEPPPAEQLLTGSIAYHDPEGVWMTGTFRFDLHTVTTEGEETETVLVINYRNGDFEHSQRIEGTRIAQKISADRCRFRIDRNSDVSDRERERHGLTCENLKSRRDYFGYLWGLPMKLRDPGARLDPSARETTFEGRPVYALRVTYEPPVGTDIWNFFLDRGSLALVGYEFFKDETEQVGEYIVLRGEARAGPLRIPSIRTWHDSGSRQPLATDTLRQVRRLIRPAKPGI